MSCDRCEICSEEGLVRLIVHLTNATCDAVVSCHAMVLQEMYWALFVLRDVRQVRQS
jgi:hypothetical protein